LYGIGIGYEKGGKLSFLKIFIYVSEGHIKREDDIETLKSSLIKDESLKASLNKDDYETISAFNAIICIIQLSNIPQNDEESLLMVKLICNECFLKYYSIDHHIVKKQYDWLKGIYGY